MIGILRTTANTRFKTEPKDSSLLTKDQWVDVPTSTQFQVKYLGEADNKHVLIELQQPYHGRFNWYAFKTHVAELDEGVHPRHAEEEDPAPAPKIILPSGRVVSINTPIIPNGSFTWGEATKNGARQIRAYKIQENIIRVATALESVRDFLGDRPIKINSWYRPPDVNKRIGGASKSRHLEGDAVDFVIDGANPHEIYRKLDPWWNNKGGLASSSTFTHIDCRGYKARWRYPH